MARRRGSSGAGLIVLAVVGGAVLLVKNAAAEVSGGTPLGIAIVAAVFFLVCFYFFLTWLNVRRKKRLRESLLQKAHAAAQKHLTALTRKRMQLVQQDAYGKEKLEKWNEELEYFLFEHLKPSLSFLEQESLSENLGALSLTINDVVQNAMRDDPSLRAFSDDMSPIDFEAFCAEELRQAGWNARVTQQSRDQGVDVIADKNNIRIVLQCKLYTGPVGNKAVQEAAAGKVHERANYGLVVTNNKYTPAAEQLAATNGILLVHYRDLRKIDSILPPFRAEKPVPAKSPVPTGNFDRAKWNALLKGDPQLNLVAYKLRPLGQKWVDKFAASYLTIKDKSHLPTLVSNIIADARKEFEQGEIAHHRRTSMT